MEIVRTSSSTGGAAKHVCNDYDSWYAAQSYGHVSAPVGGNLFHEAVPSNSDIQLCLDADVSTTLIPTREVSGYISMFFAKCIKYSTFGTRHNILPK